MIGHVERYERVKRREDEEYKTARSFFEAKGICYQNFYKFYRRYIESGRDEQALLPTRRGPKPKYKEMPIVDGSLEEKVLEYRKLGYNKYIISEAIKKEGVIKKGCSASSVYRILRRYGESRIRKGDDRRKAKFNKGACWIFRSYRLSCITERRGKVRP